MSDLSFDSPEPNRKRARTEPKVQNRPQRLTAKLLREFKATHTACVRPTASNCWLSLPDSLVPVPMSFLDLDDRVTMARVCKLWHRGTRQRQSWSGVISFHEYLRLLNAPLWCVQPRVVNLNYGAGCTEWWHHWPTNELQTLEVSVASDGGAFALLQYIADSQGRVPLRELNFFTWSDVGQPRGELFDQMPHLELLSIHVAEWNSPQSPPVSQRSSPIILPPAVFVKHGGGLMDQHSMVDLLAYAYTGSKHPVSVSTSRLTHLAIWLESPGSMTSIPDAQVFAGLRTLILVQAEVHTTTQADLPQLETFAFQLLVKCDGMAGFLTPRTWGRLTTIEAGWDASAEVIKALDLALLALPTLAVQQLVLEDGKDVRFLSHYTPAQLPSLRGYHLLGTNMHEDDVQSIRNWPLEEVSLQHDPFGQGNPLRLSTMLNTVALRQVSVTGSFHDLLGLRKDQVAIGMRRHLCETRTTTRDALRRALKGSCLGLYEKL